MDLGGTLEYSTLKSGVSHSTLEVLTLYAHATR
jgi:hypothetical protein